MIKSAQSGGLESRFPAIPAPPPGARTGERARAAHSSLELNVYRLRYFMDLLQTGYRHALHPEPLPRSLRTDRIRLCIDVPELDTVPLWSVTDQHGAVAIPFVEFILTRICRTLEVIADDVGASGEDLVLARGALQRVLERASPGGPMATPELPRLADVYLPRDLLEEICGPRGLLGEIADLCETLLAARSVHPGH